MVGSVEAEATCTIYGSERLRAKITKQVIGGSLTDQIIRCFGIWVVAFWQCQRSGEQVALMLVIAPLPLVMLVVIIMVIVVTLVYGLLRTVCRHAIIGQCCMHARVVVYCSACKEHSTFLFVLALFDVYVVIVVVKLCLQGCHVTIGSYL